MGIAVGAAAVVLLGSCTPPSEYGVRLNADDTIDFVLCTGYYGDGDLIVDYQLDEDDVDDPEWVMTSEEPARLDRILIEYGIAPVEPKSIHLEDPPADWVSVTFGWEYAERSELVVDEWLWSTEFYPWIPDRPCTTVPPALESQ